MDEKSPRQRLKESLQKNADHIAKEWPAEVRAAISTARVFEVPRKRPTDTEQR
jgi:hypothetical protein